MMEKRLVPMLLSIIFIVGIAVGAFLFFTNVEAGVSATLSVTPYQSGTDNLVSALNTRWVFTVTTTQALVAGDIIRFVLPTTTGAPFTISSPTGTVSGITLYKTPGVSAEVGVSSTVVSATSRPTFYGYVSSTVATGTTFSAVLRYINNTNVASSGLQWTVEAGTLASPAAPHGLISDVKFSASVVEAIIEDSGGGTPTITNLALTDADTSGYGLDGRDFRVTWNPGTTTPTGMSYASIYIATSGVNFTTSNLSSACGGTMAMPVGYFHSSMYLTFATHTLPMYMLSDSCNVNFSTSSSYVAWIYVNATQSFIVSSTAVSYANAYDSTSDSNAPQIDHTSAHSTRESATATLYASVSDDQTTSAEFAAGTSGAYTRIVYGQHIELSSSTANGVQVVGNLFRYTVPAAIVPAAGSTGTFEYYLKTRDKSGNIRYSCAAPSITGESACAAVPFITMSIAAASLQRQISGTVYSSSGSSSTIGSAYVFAGGFAMEASVSASNGTYSISNLPSNSSVDLQAYKVNYCQMKRTETIGSTDKTGINLYMNTGECGYYGGGGETGGSPTVNFSSPSDGTQGVSVTDNIRVGISQPMDASTVNDASATSTSDNVYLINNLTSAVVTGTVTYCANNSSSGCSSLATSESNVILFDPVDSLATGTNYALIITERVKNQGGRSVQGNRTGGGHRVGFTTVYGSYSMGELGAQYGQTGQYMPPYVKSVTPAPGMTAAGNVNVMIEFNQAMRASTITTSTVKLRDMTLGSYTTLSSVTLDSNESRFVKLTPQASLTNGSEYRVEVYGSVANSLGITMRGTTGANDRAFSSSFRVSSANDSTAPTLYASLTSGSSVSVNQIFEFGASEPLDFSTINTTNIIMYRGGTSVTTMVSYDPSKNSIYVAAISALLPNTTYSITINGGVKDLANNGVATTTYTYTTGAGDSTAPAIKEARCDDYRCRVVFTEPMIHDSQVDNNWAYSVINTANYTIERTSPSSATISITGRPMTYSSVDYSVVVEGVAGLAAGDTYRVTVSSNAKDLSENSMATSSNQNVYTGKVESSQTTFGSYGSAGMFGPPTASLLGSSSVGGAEFQPQGFGNYTAEQFAFGQADTAYPFNSTASQDSNTFNVYFTPNVAVQNGDQVQIIFPNGTNITNAAFDTNSFSYNDLNMFAAGTVTGTALSVDTSTLGVLITLGVSGTPTASSGLNIDLKKIINPAIPKDSSSGGYTLTLKLLRSNTVLASKTSMPYYIQAGGSRSIVVNVTANPASGANGTVYLHGGGPGGQMEKTVTLTNGQISSVDNVATTSVRYASLSDGCYYLNVEPIANLGGIDYMTTSTMSESVCVDATNPSQTKNFLYTDGSGSNFATMTVKFVDSSGLPFTFGGKNIDIFAGGPTRSVMKTLTGVTTTASAGYQLKLGENGQWYVGVSQSMSKGASTGMATTLGVMTPPPMNVVVSNIATAPSITAGAYTPSGVSFNDNTDTVSFIFAAADKTVTGTVRDTVDSGLANVNVFLHRQGFGAPVVGTTDASGNFSLSVPDYGTYEVGAYMNGLPSVTKQVEVKSTGNLPNPLILTMYKTSYYISGKVLDSNNNSISYASVKAIDANNNTVFGQTAADGSYTVFVGNGTWVLNVMLPPDKTDICGSFSKTVTVSGASQTNQNITPSSGSCYTISGSVTVGGSSLTGLPLFVEEWDATNSRPVIGGFKRPSSVDSSGSYSVKVAGSKTYRVGTWHPEYGEMSTTTVVGTADVTGVNISLATTDSVIFSFTGGTSTMNAMIEMKNTTDKNKVIRKQVAGLSSSTTILVQNGASYNYFVDIFGIGKYSGIVTSTAGNDTVTIDVSSFSYITVTGTLKDGSNNALPGALVMLTGTSTNMVVTDLTDSNGVYELKVKAGSYKIDSSLANYVSPAAANVNFTSNTSAYDFGGSSPDQPALQSASYYIEGTVSSSAGAAMNKGYVWASNASGTTVSAPISATGAYSLPVNNGVWTVKSIGNLHSETTMTSTVTISSANSTGNNFALTASSTRISTSTSGILAANAGGTVNDASASGLKLTVGGGVLEGSSGNVTLNFEKNYNAPDTETYQALGNASFSIEATGKSAIKLLSGTAEIQIDYTSLLNDLPSGVGEGDLKLAYYSPEKGDYIPVEGGYTIDTTNNSITGLVSHFTDFVITYYPPSTSTGAGITVTQPGGNTAATEGGSTDTVTYVLTTQPSANVAISLTGAQVSLSPTTLTFTSANYGSTQTVTVTAIDDTNVEGTHTGTISHTVSSSDTNYSSISISDISVTITDNESSGGGGTTIDTTPPTNTSVLIANGASTSGSTTVSLTLSATGANYMMIGNDSSFTSSTWETYATSKSWILTSGLGVKTVYAKFKDLANNISAAVSDSIELISSTAAAVTTTTAAIATTTVSAATSTVDSAKAVSEPKAAETAATTKPATSVKYNFVTYLDLGSSGEEVKQLQQLLKDLGYFTYPSLTGYYGSATKEALIKFQQAKGIPAVGFVGSQTRAALNNAQKETVAVKVGGEISQYAFSKYVALGHENEEVKQLQIKLKVLGYFTYPTATGYFGQLTKTALVAYQKAKGLSQTGALDQTTRDSLNGGISVTASQTQTQTSTLAKVKYTFTSYLYVGSSGEEVKQLQLKLKELGYFTYDTATGYFGDLTKAAVVKFQQANLSKLGLAPGWVGPGTRALLNEK